MIDQKENETRIQYLARVLYEFMKKHPIAADCTIDYDGLTCDGNCLANEIAVEVGADAAWY